MRWQFLLVSLAVVPLTLIGVLLPVDWLLQLAAWLMSLCTASLHWMSVLPAAVWQQHAPPWWSVPLALLGALWILAPRGLPARWLGVVAFLPLVAVKASAPAPGELWVDVLDVGQGLSAVVRTHSHTLLYDAGPAFSSDTDAGNRVVVPFLRAQGVEQLDGFVITHEDSDHFGGATSVLEALPVDWVATSLPPDAQPVALAHRRIRCFSGQSWDWDGVRFTVLHPDWESYNSPALKDNARSCVLKIESAFGSVLLPADIEQGSEMELLQKHREALHADVLVAPHHGSGTSSSTAVPRAGCPASDRDPRGLSQPFRPPQAGGDGALRGAGQPRAAQRSGRGGALRFSAEGLAAEGYRGRYRRYWQNR